MATRLVQHDFSPHSVRPWECRLCGRARVEHRAPRKRKNAAKRRAAKKRTRSRASLVRSIRRTRPKVRTRKTVARKTAARKQPRVSVSVRVNPRRGSRRNPPIAATGRTVRDITFVALLGFGPYDETIKIPYEDATDKRHYVHEMGEHSSIGAAGIVIHLVEVEGHGKCVLFAHEDAKPLWTKV